MTFVEFAGIFVLGFIIGAGLAAIILEDRTAADKYFHAAARQERADTKARLVEIEEEMDAVRRARG